jgi:hypothetical protein
MTTPTSSHFLWSDSWLLAAIHGASYGGERPTLARIIAVGDFLNHAIFTSSEINGGVSRLSHAGLIVTDRDAFVLTEAGKKITREQEKKPEGPHKHLKTIRTRLGAPDWTPAEKPDKAGNPEDPKLYVSDSEISEAYQNYLGMLKKPKKKKANKAVDSTRERARVTFDVR